MLKPELLRELTVDPDHHPRGQPHLSAASGLVRVHDHWYAVADDEHHLGMWRHGSSAPVRLLRLFDGELPDKKKERKAQKPDLETLTALPPMPGYPHGALLTLGSGSKPQRQRGLLIALDAHGKLAVADNMEFGATDGILSQALDLSELYAPLRTQFADLNIEGLFMADNHMHLLHRGNKGDQRSACIAYNWTALRAWLMDADTPLPAPHVLPIELGECNGVPLSPTDGAALPRGAWLLSAVAENTSDSFRDGVCEGSGLAVVDAQGKLLALHTLQDAPKVEGIAVHLSAQHATVTMVTDADDPKVPSRVLTVKVPLPQQLQGTAV
jgi:hypothetical protein